MLGRGDEDGEEEGEEDLMQNEHLVTQNLALVERNEDLVV